MLYALSELDTVNPLLQSLVKYLVFQGGDLLRQFNTEQALWMILGLKSYSGLVDHSDTNFIARVKLNGTLILDQSFTDSSANEIYQTSVAAKNLSHETINDIFIKKEGLGPLYLDAQLISYLDPTQVAPVENGLIVVRMLFEMTDDGKYIPAVTTKKGKSYLSQLKVVVPEAYENVTLTDSIPAGMKLGGQLVKLKEPFSQRVVENGVVTYYAPYLPAGVYTINTPLLAILPGSYLHLPATIQPLFRPSIFSQTGGGSLSVID
jgi:hypothetical protein